MGSIAIYIVGSIIICTVEQIFINMQLSDIHIIEPYNAYVKTKRKKHWHEIVEEQMLIERIISEQQKQKVENSLKNNVVPNVTSVSETLVSPTLPPDSPPIAASTVIVVGPAQAGAGGQPPIEFFSSQNVQ